MKMEFRDLKAQYQRYKSEIDSAIQRVLDSGIFIGGEEVSNLERRLAESVGVSHCISCANGTEAMTLLMMAWGLGKGDAVFVPDFTFFATGEIVSFCGATPIFVDVDSDTFNIDPSKLEEAIRRVSSEGRLVPRAVIPVDLFGLPADHPEVRFVASRYGLRVIEDAAQGFGGSIGGKKACSFGDAATTSFFPAKPLGCYGDGGAVFTDDDELARLLRSIKLHGKGEHKYDNVRIGVNSRLDTLQAAVLDVKLTALLSHELKDVNRIACRYSEGLRDLVNVPRIPGGYVSSYAQYTIRLRSGQERDGLKRFLESRDIPSMVYYPKPMHRQEAFLYDARPDEFRTTDLLCETVLSLPMHPYLADDQTDRVIEAVRAYIESNRKITGR